MFHNTRVKNNSLLFNFNVLFMKKNFLFAAMSIMALASCSNDDIVDVNNGSGISFRASLDKAVTRANATNLQNLAAFNVTAIGNNTNYFRFFSV